MLVGKCSNLLLYFERSSLQLLEAIYYLNWLIKHIVLVKHLQDGHWALTISSFLHEDLLQRPVVSSILQQGHIRRNLKMPELQNAVLSASKPSIFTSSSRQQNFSMPTLSFPHKRSYKLFCVVFIFLSIKLDTEINKQLQKL